MTSSSTATGPHPDLVDATDAHRSTDSAPATPCVRLDIEATEDAQQWDEFVTSTPGGDHQQTSLWAKAKAGLGWDAARLVVRIDDEIVGGVQLLMRQVTRIGRIAYAPRGPLLATRDEQLLDVLHAGLMEFGRSERVRYLKVQPPKNRHDLVEVLERLGWTPNVIGAAPIVSIRVDVTPPTEQLLARMRRTTRQHIRQGEQRGVRVRVGTEHDLDAFYRIVEATGRRQGFAPKYPLSYYAGMWRAFSTGGRSRLLMAELYGELLSVALLIAFGDSVTCKVAGWSGERAAVSPNQPMHWTAIQWAKKCGYHWYDFDGISRAADLAVQRSGTLAESAKKGLANFKLGFGGELVLFPRALDNSPYRFLRPVVRAIAPRLDRAEPIVHRALGRGR